MIILANDFGMAPLPARLSWDRVSTAVVSGSEPWSRVSRRLVDELRDEQGHRFPLRDELWLTVYPPRADGLWRAEADAVGPAVVGRATASDDAVHDWRKRFRMTVQRYLEMRPFEMTLADRDLWNRLQTVIDIPRYKAMKPIIVRQIGKVVKARSGLTVVQWEDGAREKVDPVDFDEAFSRYRVGQPFEAVVTRHPLTFRLIRADAVRRLPGSCPEAEERSRAIWQRAVGSSNAPATEESHGNDAIDERFWLNASE